MGRHGLQERTRPFASARRRAIRCFQGGLEALEQRALLAAVFAQVEPLSVPLALTNSGAVYGLAQGDFILRAERNETFPQSTIVIEVRPCWQGY